MTSSVPRSDPRGWPLAATWGVAALSTVALAELARLGERTLQRGTDDSASALWLACAVLAIGCLLGPPSREAGPDRAAAPLPRMGRTLAWPGVLGAITAAGVALHAPTPSHAVALGWGVFLTGFAVGGVTRLLASAGLGDELARTVTLVGVALLGAAPLWMAPLLDIGSAPPFLPRLIVALSPLTHLATLADFDYLRAHWFYTHTSLGSFDTGHPSAAVLGAAYLAIGSISTLLGPSLDRREETPDVTPAGRSIDQREEARE